MWYGKHLNPNELDFYRVPVLAHISWRRQQAKLPPYWAKYSQRLLDKLQEVERYQRVHHPPMSDEPCPSIEGTSTHRPIEDAVGSGIGSDDRVAEDATARGDQEGEEIVDGSDCSSEIGDTVPDHNLEAVLGCLARVRHRTPRSWKTDAATLAYAVGLLPERWVQQVVNKSCSNLRRARLDHPTDPDDYLHSIRHLYYTKRVPNNQSPQRPVHARTGRGNNGKDDDFHVNVGTSTSTLQPGYFYGHKGVKYDENSHNKPVEDKPIFALDPISPKHDHISNIVPLAFRTKSEEVDMDLYYYLRTEAFGLQRDHKLLLQLKHKGLRFMDKFDLSRYTMEDRYRMVAKAVIAAFKLDKEEVLMRDSLSQPYRQLQHHLWNQFLGTGLTRTVTELARNPFNWLAIVVTYL